MQMDEICGKLGAKFCRCEATTKMSADEAARIAQEAEEVEAATSSALVTSFGSL